MVPPSFNGPLCAAIIEKSKIEGWVRWMTARSPWRPRHQFDPTILIEHYLTLTPPLLPSDNHDHQPKDLHKDEKYPSIYNKLIWVKT